MANQQTQNTQNPENIQNQGANYDPNLVSAETAARMEREGENFKTTPTPEGGIDTTAGYRVDREGLANNFPVEPEMYVNEPGDLRAKEIERVQERAAELQEVNESGGKGPGII
ncbi:hypothetical protein K4A83_14845 [Spirulina subsalsa FACHB-351]|uniref:Uncharacterized protein n=1 Tax=Spirulina subsalsa FACHB-351 TaxID=234711 RepID=A0ABT3L7P9_9CYAN|nr:hypothetical protein [Spirulina subsalsa]MCW6037543.1 hypothetical protein [Spirulina subsalsa FACHB-351]